MIGKEENEKENYNFINYNNHYYIIYNIWKNVKERYRVDTNNSFNKNNTNIIYSAGTFKINPFNINEAVEEVDYIFIGKVDKYLGSYYNPEKILWFIVII